MLNITISSKLYYAMAVLSIGVVTYAIMKVILFLDSRH